MKSLYLILIALLLIACSNNTPAPTPRPRPTFTPRPQPIKPTNEDREYEGGRIIFDSPTYRIIIIEDEESGTYCRLEQSWDWYNKWVNMNEPPCVERAQ